MTNLRNKQNYRLRTWKFRDRYHLKGGIRQGCFLKPYSQLSNSINTFSKSVYNGLLICKIKENPCVGTDESTPLMTETESVFRSIVLVTLVYRLLFQISL